MQSRQLISNDYTGIVIRAVMAQRSSVTP